MPAPRRPVARRREDVAQRVRRRAGRERSGAHDAAGDEELAPGEQYPSLAPSVDGVLGAGQAEREQPARLAGRVRQHRAGAVGPGVDDEQPGQRLDPAGSGAAASRSTTAAAARAASRSASRSRTCRRRRGQPGRAGRPAADARRAQRHLVQPAEPADELLALLLRAASTGRMPSCRMAPTAHSTGCLTS